MNQYTDYSLLEHNTFGMDVRAAMFVEYATVDELLAFLHSDAFVGYRQHFIHIGAGSNLLFAGDYDGLVPPCPFLLFQTGNCVCAFSCL